MDLLVRLEPPIDLTTLLLLLLLLSFRGDMIVLAKTSDGHIFVLLLPL